MSKNQRSTSPPQSPKKKSQKIRQFLSSKTPKLQNYKTAIMQRLQLTKQKIDEIQKQQKQNRLSPPKKRFGSSQEQVRFKSEFQQFVKKHKNNLKFILSDFALFGQVYDKVKAMSYEKIDALQKDIQVSIRKLMRRFDSLIPAEVKEKVEKSRLRTLPNDLQIPKQQISGSEILEDIQYVKHDPQPVPNLNQTKSSQNSQNSQNSIEAQQIKSEISLRQILNSHDSQQRKESDEIMKNTIEVLQYISKINEDALKQQERESSQQKQNQKNCKNQKSQMGEMGEEKFGLATEQKQIRVSGSLLEDFAVIILLVLIFYAFTQSLLSEAENMILLKL